MPCNAMHCSTFLWDPVWGHVGSNWFVETLDEYFLKDLFIVIQIAAQCLIPKRLFILHQRQSRQLSKAQDLVIYVCNNVFCDMRLQKIVGHFTIIGQCSLFPPQFDFDDNAMREFMAAVSGFFMKKCKSPLTAPSWIQFRSHVACNVKFERKLIFEIRSNELKLFVFIWAWNHF